MGSAFHSFTTPPDAVLGRFELFHTRDLEEARQWGARVFCENRLNNLDSRRCQVNAWMYYRRMRGIGVGRMSYGSDVSIDPGELDSFLLIQMPIRGRELVQVSGQAVCSTPRTASVLNSHNPVLIRHFEGTEKLIIRVDRDVLERHCTQHLGRAMRAPVEFSPTMDLGTAAGKRWMHLMSWLYEGLSADEEHVQSPLLAAQIEQMLITMLLTCQPHNYSDELAGDERSIAPSFVKKTERFIEEHAHEPITIIELAEHAGVSSRSLFTGFRRFRNTSPMVYLKEVRLRRVHDELRRLERGETTVTSVALRWGFSHLGHFTTDYKRRFGESPSDTLAR